MKVLITGGEGFIGSHVIDKFVEDGFEVVSIDNNSSPNSGYLNPKVKYIKADILSTDVENVFREQNIDYCVHLAAQASVTSSVKDPIYDANTNILGSINILRLCKKYNCKKIILASSAAVYGNPKYLPVDETHSTEVLSPYGLSKLTMERYAQISGVPYVVCRFSNVYGERQTSSGEAGVVAIFNDLMMSNDKIYIDGDGEQYRDFIYVKDVAKIIVKLANEPIVNEIINVSTSKTCSINNLYNVMSKICDYKFQPNYREERIGDIKHSILDNSKLCRLLGLKEFTGVEEGLKQLVNNNKEIYSNI